MPNQQRENNHNHNLRRSWWRQELPRLGARDCWQPHGMHSRGFNARPSPLPPLPSLPTGMAKTPSVRSKPRSLYATERRRESQDHQSSDHAATCRTPPARSALPTPDRPRHPPHPGRAGSWGGWPSSSATHFHPDHPSGCSKRCYLGALRKWYSGQLWTRFRQKVLGDNF